MLVIVGDFDSVCVVPFPSETYPVLVVDADAVLASPITFQRFETVAWRESQFFETRGGFELS